MTHYENKMVVYDGRGEKITMQQYMTNLITSKRSGIEMVMLDHYFNHVDDGEDVTANIKVIIVHANIR